MTITAITSCRRTRSSRAIPRQTVRPATHTDLERVASIEAEIRANEAQAVVWPEHAAWFMGEANRLRDELHGTPIRRAA